MIIKISPVTCHKCNKPVNKLEVTHDPYQDSYRVTVTCHGEKEITDLPKYLLYDATAVHGGQAFRGDRLEQSIS